MKKLGIYVHIPFCRQKCSYCDFYSVNWNDESENKYVEAVLNEIKGYKERLNGQYVADSVFFGGGTPTIIKPESLYKIMEALRDLIEVNKNSEISMEANPNTLTFEKLREYREIGINRLSIGVQSLNDDILKKIGRVHDSRQAIESIDRAKSAGFSNINTDVMFNIPGQEVSDIEDTISRLIERNIEHISFYSLKLEKGTPMYALEKNNKIVMPDEEYEREMYYAGRSLMERNNFLQYEISNFSKNGFECRHNLKYWSQDVYIGLGPSAHSFMDGVRYSNPADLKMYCVSGFNRIVHERMNYEDLMFEYIMLRLRLSEGVDIHEFNSRFSTDFIKIYQEQISHLGKNNLIELSDGHIKLTEKGMDISNYVFEKFMQ